jgi:hypothetical protein
VVHLAGLVECRLGVRDCGVEVTHQPARPTVWAERVAEPTVVARPAEQLRRTTVTLHRDLVFVLSSARMPTLLNR